jgi:hypothetical protein
MYHFDLINSLPLKVSPHGSFEVNQLCHSLAICEAKKGDINNWGNATETEPAFVAYLGCKKEEVSSHIKTFKTFYRCELCEIREPKYLKGFEAEIKIRGMQRESDTNAFGLDYLVESEESKHFGCNSDEYQYYSTSVMPRW